MSQKVKTYTTKRGLLDINLKEFWNYRDLLMLFVKRDFISIYKQTILGPLWFFVQPIMTTAMFTLVFGYIAKIDVDGTPKFLFYLSGITMWNYFSDCIGKTSNTFVNNSDLFGKVYFPRLVTPASIVISNLLRFGVQFLLFTVFYLYFYFNGSNIQPNLYALLLPLLIIMMAFIGLGIGLLISSLTTKYRDLQFLMAFSIQLVMYATPIVYPLSLLQEKLGDKFWITYINPISPIIETFKYGFLGRGILDLTGLGISFIFSLIVLFLGIITFNKVERSFMDTV
jgi:lipopolysaccharide transport system permease protein